MIRCTPGLIGLLAAVVAASAAGSPADPGEVPLVEHDGHFERNDSGLTGPETCLVLADSASFDRVFGVAALGAGPVPKQRFVTPETFDRNLVLAVIKRGESLTSYSKVKAHREGDTLTLTFRSTTRKTPGGRYNSPLIVSAPRDGLARVVFVENGQPVATLPTPAAPNGSD